MGTIAAVGTTASAQFGLPSAVFSNAVNGTATGGESLVVDGVGPDLNIKGIEAGTGITLSSGASCVTISADVASVNNQRPRQFYAGFLLTFNKSRSKRMR